MMYRYISDTIYQSSTRRGWYSTSSCSYLVIITYYHSLSGENIRTLYITSYRYKSSVTIFNRNKIKTKYSKGF